MRKIQRMDTKNKDGDASKKREVLSMEKLKKLLNILDFTV
jgi:hypothetical protein